MTLASDDVPVMLPRSLIAKWCEAVPGRISTEECILVQRACRRAADKSPSAAEHEAAVAAWRTEAERDKLSDYTLDYEGAPDAAYLVLRPSEIDEAVALMRRPGSPGEADEVARLREERDALIADRATINTALGTRTFEATIDAARRVTTELAALRTTPQGAPAADDRCGVREAALQDALSGWRYIRARHGDLAGVGWDRVEERLVAALAAGCGVKVGRDAAYTEDDEDGSGGAEQQLPTPQTTPAPSAPSVGDALRGLRHDIVRMGFINKNGTDWIAKDAVLGKIDAALREQPPSARPDETAWLIELPRAGSTPTWFTGRNPVLFSDDANEAIRFARKQDAEAMIAGWNGWELPMIVGAVATEHAWMDGKPPSARSSAEERTRVVTNADGGEDVYVFSQGSRERFLTITEDDGLFTVMFSDRAIGLTKVVQLPVSEKPIASAPEPEKSVLGEMVVPRVCPYKGEVWAPEYITGGQWDPRVPCGALGQLCPACVRDGQRSLGRADSRQGGSA